MKVIYAPLIHRDSMVDASPCLVSSVIELPFGQLPSEIHCCSYDEEEWMAAPNVSMSL